MVIYIFIVMCSTWYQQIARPKIFMFMIGLFTGKKLVDVCFSIAYVYLFYIHPTVWFIIMIFSCILLGICAKYNQAFGYASIGFSSTIGTCL